MAIVVGVVGVLGAGAAPGAVLVNPSFESGTMTSFTGWSIIGPGGNVFREPAPVLQGAFSAKMFSQFVGLENFTFITQDLAALPGQNWSVGINVQHVTGDALAGGNDARLKVEFLDAGFANLFQLEQIVLTAADPTDVWTAHTVSAAAPALTAYMRITLVFHGDAANSGGAAYYDVASVTAIPEPTSGALALLGATGLISSRRRARRRSQR